MPLDDFDESGLDIFENKPIKVLDEGVTQGSINKLNFEGTGVAATVSGLTATVTITAGGGAHATSHQDGGSDEINIGALSGTPAALTTHEAAADPHTGYRLESADHSHQTTGAQAGKLDHGLALDGLTDNDHTQYILHSLATAINDFLVASGSGAYVKKTLAETLTILGKGAASGLASLSAGTLVVENPANATATPTASKIVIADGSAKIDGWVSATSLTVPGIAELATSAEINTGTDSTRAIPVDQYVASARNVRYVLIRVLDPATSHTVSTTVGGDIEFPFTGTITEIGAFADTAGTTGLGTIDVNLNGTTLMTTNKITLDSTEKTSRTAATAPTLTTTAIAAGDILTVDIDGIQTTPAKGLTIRLGIRQT